MKRDKFSWDMSMNARDRLSITHGDLGRLARMLGFDDVEHATRPDPNIVGIKMLEVATDEPYRYATRTPLPPLKWRRNEPMSKKTETETVDPLVASQNIMDGAVASLESLIEEVKGCEHVPVLHYLVSSLNQALSIATTASGQYSEAMGE